MSKLGCEENMEKKYCIFIILFCSFLLISCGSSNMSSGPVRSNPGPVACLASGFSQNLQIIDAKIITNDFKTSNQLAPFVMDHSFGSEDIVGGLNASSTLPASNNTVAILIRQQGSSNLNFLCTGTVVTGSLILTAAHCFDNADKNSLSPGVVIFSNSYKSPLNASNSAEITCWQRNYNYLSCQDNSIASCNLYDIAWVKIGTDASAFGYQPLKVLGSPSSISTSETKWMAGFGKLNDSIDNFSGNKYIVDSSAQGHSDVILSDRVNLFNSLTFSNAYQNYLTIIGPNSGKGTCQGDSGGPVYVSRGGNYVVAALTQGSNNILTPKPSGSYPSFSFDTNLYASCNDGYGVYTTIGNYVSWIQSSSGVSLSVY